MAICHMPFAIRAARVFACLSFCLPAPSPGQEKTAATSPEPSPLATLPMLNFFGGKVNYRCDDYLAVAAKLQAMGKDQAVQQIADELEAVGDGPTELLDGLPGYKTEYLYVLCRMLFVAREGVPFRRPGLGYSGSDPIRDPLEPIHIVDGVPFLTFQGRYHTIGGSVGSPNKYFYYCVTHCDWSSFRFTPKTMEQKTAALKKLVAERPDLATLEDLPEQIRPR